MNAQMELQRNSDCQKMNNSKNKILSKKKNGVVHTALLKNTVTSVLKPGKDSTKKYSSHTYKYKEITIFSNILPHQI